MSKLTTALLQAIPRLADHHILIVGDVLLDEYLSGRASRLSREAPIPVLEFEERRTIPGGAANPAMNVVSLGSQASQIGLLGDDSIGQELTLRLSEADINTAGLVIDADRCTTQKTRLVSRGSLRFPQQLARLDRIDRHPPAPQTEARLIAQLEKAAPHTEAIIISDYGNGLLTSAVVAALRRLSQAHQLLTVVDSQGRLDKYREFAVIRANDRDTAAFLNQPLETEANFEQATAQLLESLHATAILIGRGPAGVSVRGRDSGYQHYPAVNPSEVYDVTGAGDTFTAVLTLGLVAELSLFEATQLANYAAGVVVRKLGNAAPTPAELTAAVQRW